MQINEEVLKRLGFTTPDGFELQSAEIGTDLPDCANPDRDDVCVTVTMKIVEPGKGTSKDNPEDMEWASIHLPIVSFVKTGPIEVESVQYLCDYGVLIKLSANGKTDKINVGDTLLITARTGKSWNAKVAKIEDRFIEAWIDTIA
ncbi:hypothetical protein [Bartonella sp. LJL80]